MSFIIEKVISGFLYMWTYSSYFYKVNRYVEDALYLLSNTTLGNLILWLFIFISLSFGFKYFLKDILGEKSGTIKLFTIIFTMLSFMAAFYISYYLKLNPILILGSAFTLIGGSALIIIFHNILLNKVFNVESAKGIKLIVSSIIIGFFATLLPGMYSLLSFVSLFLLAAGIIALFYDALKNPGACLFTSSFLFIISYWVYHSTQNPATLFVLGGTGILLIIIALYIIVKALSGSYDIIRGAYIKEIGWSEKMIKDIINNLRVAIRGVKEIESILRKKKSLSEKDCNEIKKIYENKILINIEKATGDLYSEIKGGLEKFVEDLEKNTRNQKLQKELEKIQNELKEIEKKVKIILKLEKKEEQEAEKLPIKEPEEFIKNFKTELEKLERGLIRFRNEILQEGKIIGYLNRLLKKVEREIEETELYKILSKHEEILSKMVNKAKEYVNILIRNINTLHKQIEKEEKQYREVNMHRYAI